MEFFADPWPLSLAVFRTSAEATSGPPAEYCVTSTLQLDRILLE